VKVRGFRIELAQIEAVLGQQEGVRDAAVVVRDGAGGTKQLVGYVAGAGLSTSVLKEGLRKQLPEHMLPAAILVMDALPQTPNGKVDRKALPAIEGPTSTEFVAPKNDTERVLTRIFADLLAAERVGTADNFFELGGQSLLATRVVARVKTELGFGMTMRDLFEAPTVAQLAARFEDPSTSAAAPNIVRLRGGAAAPAITCVHPVSGSVSCYLPLVGGFAPGAPIVGIEASGLSEDTQPLQTFEQMAARYVDGLRAAGVTSYRFLGWSLGGIVALEMARCLRSAGNDVDALVMVDPPLVIPGSTRVAVDPALSLIVDVARMSGQWSATLEERLADFASFEPQFLCAQKLGVFPVEMTFNEFRRRVRVFEANQQALASYVPRTYDGPALLIAAEHGNGLTVSGWREWIRGSVELLSYPVDHYAVLAVAASDIQERIAP
jgi:thioesterase domain-containing protein